MPEAAIIRLLVVDDSSIVRSGIRSNIASDPSIEVVGEAQTGREGLEKVGELRPDVVLMDVRMPDMDGIAATAEVTRQYPGTRVLMLTWSEDGQNLVRAIRAGARGYLLHATFTAADLCAAVRTVFEGGALISPFLAPFLLQTVREQRAGSGSQPGQGGDPHDSRLSDPLTARESEILGLIRDGRTNREIASLLGVSDKTVKNHINNIYSKLQVSEREQAARYPARPDPTG